MSENPYQAPREKEDHAVVARRKIDWFDLLVYVLVPTIWILTALNAYWTRPSTIREMVGAIAPLFCSACMIVVWWDRRRRAARLEAEKTS